MCGAAPYGRLINLAAAVLGAVGAIVLFKGSFAYEGFAQTYGRDWEAIKAQTKRNRRRQIMQRIGQLHSPKHALYRLLQGQLGMRFEGDKLKGPVLDRGTISGEFMPRVAVSFRAGDLESFATWVYKNTPSSKGVKTVELGPRWRRFEHAVHKLAA
jgi:hypothetical protein